MLKLPSNTLYYCSTEPSCGLHNRELVDFVLNRTLDALRDYIKSSYPEKPSRFAHILLKLPTLRDVASKMASECLFAQSLLHLAVPQIVARMVDIEHAQWCKNGRKWTSPEAHVVPDTDEFVQSLHHIHKLLPAERSMLSMRNNRNKENWRRQIRINLLSLLQFII